MEKSEFFRGYFEIQMTPENTSIERRDLVRFGSDFSIHSGESKTSNEIRKHYVQL